MADRDKSVWSRGDMKTNLRRFRNTAFIAAISIIGAFSRDARAATTFTTLAGAAAEGSVDGTGSAASFNNPQSVAVDSSGNVYVADRYNYTIRKITSAGVVSTLAGSPGLTGSADGLGSAARFNAPQGVTVDSTGNVYVADTDNNTIRKITSAGVVSTLAGSPGLSGSTDGSGSAARFYYPQDVAVDSSGNVYVADTFNQTIRKIAAAGVVATLAGSPGLGGSADGTGIAARFIFPAGVAVDSSGNVYVADTNNCTIRTITSAGVVTTLAGSHGSIGSADGPGGAARFYYPYGVAVDLSGNVYVADTDNSTIRKVTTASVVTTLAGSPDSGSNDGTGSAARFYYPFNVAVDSSGNIYVADSDNCTIRKITSAGVVTTLAGSAGLTGSADGTGSAARFNRPEGVAVDLSGNVYVADSLNSTVRKITPAGVVTTLAGSAGLTGSADGTGSTARFIYPQGAAVDSSGNVYTADADNCTIRKITSVGVVTTLAGSPGVIGSTDGIGSAAHFSFPYGVAVDSTANVYVADSGNNTIRRITSAGVVITLAGSPGANGSADGTGNAARFHNPSGVAVDSSGNIYVADTDNCTIRKITSAGVVTTLAGLPGSAGSADGTGISARFYNPFGVAVDSFSNVYVADTYNFTIRFGTAAIADMATIDSPAGPINAVRQLDTAPQTATSWTWSIIVRPPGSTATLSSSTIRNPTFTPDAGDLYRFQCVAASATGTSITTVDLMAQNPLTITANAASKTYGAANPVFSVSSSGLLTGDSASNLGGTLSFATGATSGSPAGIYTVKPSGLTSTRYAITFVAGNLTIAQAALTVTADTQSKVYGNANPALTATISGFVNGDTVAVVSCSAALSTTALTSSGAGWYPIIPAAGTLSAANYDFTTSTYVNGTLTVNTAVLTVTADAKSKVYGANPSLTATISGFVNGDTAAVVSGSAALSTTATNSSSAGSTFPITVAAGMLSAANYDFIASTYVNGTLTVTQAALTVTADAQSKVYGTANPALTATITGFVNGDTVAVVSGLAALSTTALTSSGAGLYPITSVAGTLSASNYDFTASTYVDGILTVTQATLTAIAADASKVFGAPNPALSGILTGVLSGDGIVAVYSSAATPATAVGIYGPASANAVVPTLNDPNGKLGNYAVTTINGTLSILDSGPALDSNLTAVPNPAMAGQSVVFTVSAFDPDGDTLTYIWDFGDQTTASGSSVSKTYTVPGTYLATVTIVDSAGSSLNATLSVTVNAPPNILQGPTLLSNMAVSGLPLVFACSSDQAVSWSFNFGDGSPAVSGDPVNHVFASPGTFTVTATATNGAGQSSSNTLILNLVAMSGSLSNFDSTGNGFPNEIDQALGIDPLNPNLAPRTGPPLTLNVTQLNIALSFISGGKNSVSLKGTLPIPAGFIANGQTVLIDVGGAIKIFTLDARGSAQIDKLNKMKLMLKSKRGIAPQQNAGFAITLGDSQLSVLLADEGLTRGAAKKSARIVPVLALFNKQFFRKDQSVQYTVAKTNSKATLTK